MSVIRSAYPALPSGRAALAVSLLAAALMPQPVLAAAKASRTQPGATAAAAAAQPGTAAGNASSVELATQIDLAEGKSTLMHLPYAAARVAVGDARVADVILINPSEVYMLGKSTGSTNMILWNKANQATIVDITVGLDTLSLRKQFDQLFPGEHGIQITVSGNSLILSGTVSDTAQAAQIVSVAGAYLQRSSRGAQGTGAAGASSTTSTTGSGATAAPNGGADATGTSGRIVNMLSIAAPQQVMLEVKIAEISKSLVEQLGADVGLAGTRGSWTYSLLSNLLSGNPSKIDAFNGKNGNFATIDAQKHDGLVKVLAEPTLMAISGQEASFLAGGTIFIPVSQTNTIGGLPTITLQEKEFGVALKFTPTVLEGGRINLRVAPEVSELNREGVGLTVSGSTATSILPAFTTRRASTTVQLFDGQSFAIGGLITNNVTADIKAFPGLGEIPILGALFRSSDFQSDRSELVFIVTPHLAKPLAADHRLPTDGYVEPNRFDFFMRSRLEGRSQTPAPAAAPAATPAAATVAPAGTPAAGFDVK